MGWKRGGGAEKGGALYRIFQRSHGASTKRQLLKRIFIDGRCHRRRRRRRASYCRRLRAR